MLLIASMETLRVGPENVESLSPVLGNAPAKEPRNGMPSFWMTGA